MPNSLCISPRNIFNKGSIMDIINKSNSNSERKTNSIFSYNNNKEQIINDYYKNNKNIPLYNKKPIQKKSRNNILKNEIYKSVQYYNVLNNNLNSFSNYNINNDYKVKSPCFSTRLRKSVNSSNEYNNKKLRRYSNPNYKIIIKNKLNKWIKHEMEFDYTPHNIDIYNLLKPNEKFISFNSNKKEKKLFNNDRKDIIPMPNPTKMKKIKNNYNNSFLISNINLNVNIKESNKKKKKSHKVNKAIKKQNIIKHLFLDDSENIEPFLYLENKLTMKTPIFNKK